VGDYFCSSCFERFGFLLKCDHGECHVPYGEEKMKKGDLVYQDHTGLSGIILCKAGVRYSVGTCSWVNMYNVLFEDNTTEMTSEKELRRIK
tara:strand:+ start:1649 stop:1921 length:273 start_codon:yes stop_codon:yes gene_type:complete